MAKSTTKCPDAGEHCCPTDQCERALARLCASMCSYVYLHYILPVPLPESLISLLQPGVFLLCPRSQYDTEPIDFSFEVRLKVFGRVQLWSI